MIDGDGIEGKSENTIKSGGKESDSGFTGNLGKLLGFNRGASNTQVIGTNKTRCSTRSILNGELSSVGL